MLSDMLWQPHPWSARLWVPRGRGELAQCPPCPSSSLHLGWAACGQPPPSGLSPMGTQRQDRRCEITPWLLGWE